MLIRTSLNEVLTGYDIDDDLRYRSKRYLDFVFAYDEDNDATDYEILIGLS